MKGWMGFDKLSPNGVYCIGLRQAQSERSLLMRVLSPFALSLSKGKSNIVVGFDKLSPNGVC